MERRTRERSVPGSAILVDNRGRDTAAGTDFDSVGCRPSPHGLGVDLVERPTRTPAAAPAIGGVPDGPGVFAVALDLAAQLVGVLLRKVDFVVGAVEGELDRLISGTSIEIIDK